MYIIKRTDEFAGWLDGLNDRMTRVRLGRRLDRAQQGNLGDVKPVGNGVCEMREHFGPGWHMYYVQHGDVLIVMLGGGDKSSQVTDIAKAVALSTTLKGSGQNKLSIRPRLGRHCGVGNTLPGIPPSGLPSAVQIRSRRIGAFLAKDAAIACETRLALTAQAHPRCWQLYFRQSPKE